MRIAVCRPQVPFVYGGAEVQADQLVIELRTRGHEAELVVVPFTWYPGTRVLDQAFLWRLVDLKAGDDRPIDRVIATKFPSYGVRHPNKVVWLIHQFRQAYDYDRTAYGQFSESPLDRATRRGVQRFDAVALGEARRIFSTSRTVADRLKQYSGFDSDLLPSPPQTLDYRTESYDDFILSVNRLDSAKRIDLLIEAARAEPALRVVVAGDGPDRERLARLAIGLEDRVELVGRVDAGRLAELYARCRAVYYAPIDEDFGLVPYEAFRSAKPVIAAIDSGGPLEIVRDGETGLVVAPESAAVARACVHLTSHLTDARAWGEAGRALAERVSWDACVEALLS